MTATTMDRGEGAQAPTRDRLVHAAIGLMTGILLYLVSEFLERETVDEPVVLGLVLCGLLLLLSYKRGDEKRVAVFGLGLGLLVGLLYFYILGLFDELAQRPMEFAMLWASVLISYVALAFFQAWQDAEDGRISYRSLFIHAWSNLPILGVAVAFTLAAWLVLFLWSAMFKLVGITLFEDIFEAELFVFPFYGAAFGLSVALTREYERIILALRTLALTLCRFLAPVLAAASILFLLVLPFTGLQLLWATGSATPILLSVMIASVLFVNAVVQYGQEEAGFPAAARYPVMAQLAVLPVFAVLAFYSTWLRVAQYGLTPERVYALAIIIVLGLHVIAYAAAVVLGRGNWWRGIIRANPVLALISVLVAVALHLPGLTPYHLSARNQYDRLATGAVSADRFDFAAMKFTLGTPGLKALARIEANGQLPDRDVAEEQLARLEETTNYYQWQSDSDRLDALSGELRDVASYMTLVPEDLTPPEGVLVTAARHGFELRNCRESRQECALAATDADGDGVTDYVLLTVGRGYASGYLIYPGEEEGEWLRMSLGSLDTGKAEAAAVMEVLKQGGIDLVQPRFRNLRVGEWEFSPNRTEGPER